MKKKRKKTKRIQKGKDRGRSMAGSNFQETKREPWWNDKQLPLLAQILSIVRVIVEWYLLGGPRS